MISSKSDLIYYLHEDARMAKWPLIPTLYQRIVELFIFPNYNRRYLTALRKAEFCINVRGGGVALYWHLFKLSRLRTKTGIDLGLNIAGPGILLPHGNVVVHMNAKIGSYCKIHQNVTIGWLGRKDTPIAVPVIGNRVVIGASAVIIGGVTIADGVVIGAGSVVNKSISEPNTTWAGNPARKISDNGSWHYLN